MNICATEMLENFVNETLDSLRQMLRNFDILRTKAIVEGERYTLMSLSIGRGSPGGRPSGSGRSGHTFASHRLESWRCTNAERRISQVWTQSRQP